LVGALRTGDDRAMTSLPPEFFRRQDEDPDELFYAVPRPDSHLDERSDAVVTRWYDERLPTDGPVLDLFAGARSHLPKRIRDAVGVGLDRAALERNQQLRAHHVLDLNLDPTLPFADASLAAVVCTASVQYLTRPIALLREVGRSLRPGAPLLVVFGNRMYPSKAVLCWRASDDDAHLRLVRGYLSAAGGFAPPEVHGYCPDGGDPLYLIATRADPSVAAE
jgi:SAM-dependent methyltransferase